jgi:hypothetical protein
MPLIARLLCIRLGAVGCNFAQPLNGRLLHRVTGEDFLCGFNLCARQTQSRSLGIWSANELGPSPRVSLKAVDRAERFL